MIRIPMLVPAGVLVHVQLSCKMLLHLALVAVGCACCVHDAAVGNVQHLAGLAGQSIVDPAVLPYTTGARFLLQQTERSSHYNYIVT